MANYPWSTKIQAYLAKIAGKEVDNLPEPTTKEQALLKEIAEGGGSGSGGNGGMVIHVTADPNDPSEFISDKTFSEIYDAAMSGASIAVFSFGTYLTNYGLWGGPGDGSYFENVEFTTVGVAGQAPSLLSINFSLGPLDETVITVQMVTLSTEPEPEPDH